ncbi:transposable element Tcb2 transposase [Trichonephila clavipes]|uniref:Transposable element Tcb2 transposase n=1 Tax=Trichonephila clavipes TaxID=2585209 RepID=A0A8X6SAS5_TRICX|nr:transposable element Tcb2 transposase [Trichonephila clavipes]
METVPGYWIHREKSWARSSKSQDDWRRSPLVDYSEADEFLEPYVRLLSGACGPDFSLMDDNARPHRVLLVDEFLESEDIRRMDWPARSLDFNPTEDGWNALGRAIAIRNRL